MLQLLLLYGENNLYNYHLLAYLTFKSMNDKNILNILSHGVIVHSNGIIVVIETNLVLRYEKLCHRDCC